MATVTTERDSLSAYGEARSTVEGTPLDPDELRLMDAYWRASLYLSLGMIYLKDNPLLREPLTLDHLKVRLLGHWGSDPGQSLVYVHLNRLIKKYDLDAIFLSGPGHGAPALLSNAYLEGTYSEVYPDKSQDADGLRRFFKQFSFPGGIGSHCTPETPGSIHEGGELGYSVSHAYGAAFDAPGRLVVVMVGDGEAETGPLATAWHSNKFLNPARDGAVLPVLHLNGYKINNPSILARISRRELEALFEGYGYTPYFVEGSEPEQHAPGAGRDARALRGRDPRDPGGGPAGRGRPAARLADGRAPQPEGLDGPARGGRPLPRRLLAVAPGADGGRAREPRAPGGPGTLAAILQAGIALRRGGPTDPRAEGPAARGTAPDERQPRGQRRPDPEAAPHPRLPRLRRRGEAAGRESRPSRPSCSATCSATSSGSTRRTSGCSAPTRRPRTGSRRRSRSPGRPGWARPSPRTPTAACSPPTAA